MPNAHSLSLDPVKACAPEQEIEITPEVIDKVALIILSADYRFENEKDVAKEILLYLKNFNLEI
jgi:hypothetical protein